MARDVRTLLHKTDPYDGFAYTLYQRNEIGWNSTSLLFDTLIQEIRPHLIIEVGVWYGKATLHMASLLKKHKVDGHILAVDTFLGPANAWTDQRHTHYDLLQVRYGRPSIYEHFLANVCYADMKHMITPFPQTSHNAAMIFKSLGIKADLIYLDASHEEWDVERDLMLYWECLAPNGIMFGDDYNRPGVRNPVSRWAEAIGRRIEEYDSGIKFVVR